MKKKAIWLGLSFVVVAAMLLVSCAKSTSTLPTTSVTTSTTSVTTSTTTTTSTLTTTQTSKTTTTSTAQTGHWWDSLGTPQYGGELTVSTNKNFSGFDPYLGESIFLISPWMDNLHGFEWTLDPAVFNFQLGFTPSDYITGCLAESWEFTDSSTYVVHLRKGVYFQNKDPVNGRELKASDVVWTYHRIYGGGDGFSAPSPYVSTAAAFKDCTSITATDNYTVVFKWDISNPFLISTTLQAPGFQYNIEAPEAVQKWGNLNDWHHAVGTGPFILTDYVSDSSVTMVKNPNYFGYDERYPQNRLPYVDKFTILILPDKSTLLAAVRTGKIDSTAGNVGGFSSADATTMKKTNPEIVALSLPSGTTFTVDLRNDVKPFNDIRVREAMQMAIDRESIASSYYNGAADPTPASLTSNNFGMGLPYQQWPQDLKDQYAYNPTKAKQLLADAGYPSGFNTDVVVDQVTDMDLVRIIQSYFAAVNIKMSIRTMESGAWASYVFGKQQDQMSMRGQGMLGVSFEPSIQLLLFQTGFFFDFQNISDPVFDSYYPKFAAATSIDQVKQIMIDANLHVAQQHYCISLINPYAYTFDQPWLKGYSGQHEAFGLNCYFFAARCWIDQNLKK